MRSLDFVAVDFETANPKRVSACSIGIAVVQNGAMVRAAEHLICPVGGHAPFQTSIHGICEQHTRGRPTFSEIFKTLQPTFGTAICGYSQFDKQVLRAMLAHFEISYEFEYTDVCSLAKESVSGVLDHRLPTVAKHLGVKLEKHHCAKHDAIACAEIALRLTGLTNHPSATPPGASAVLTTGQSEQRMLNGFLRGILADGEVNYREAAELLYTIEDTDKLRDQCSELRTALHRVLDDGVLSLSESEWLRVELSRVSMLLSA